MDTPEDYPDPDEMDQEASFHHIESTEYPNDTPVYDIVPIVRNSSVSPGETVEIEVYFHGTGPVATNKFQVVTDSQILQEEKAGEVQLAIISGEGEEQFDLSTGKTENHDQAAVIAGGDVTQAETIDKRGLLAVLDPGFFWPIQRSPRAYPQVAGEFEYLGTPPVLVKLYTESNASPGDYTIAFTLTYGTDEAHQTHVKESIHIESWTERNEKLLQIIGVVMGTFFAALSVIVSVVFGLL